MKKIIEILMSRDGMSKEEATREVVSFVQWVRERLEDPVAPGLWEIEEEFLSLFGLEPDYLNSILFSLC